MKTPKKYRFLIEETQRKREEEEAASLAAAEAINAPDGPVLRPPNRKKRRADITDDDGEGNATCDPTYFMEKAPLNECIFSFAASQVFLTPSSCSS